MPRITITDIAKAAGVSKTSVSFAFNAPDQLAATTVAHIHAIAEQLGYTPDPIARSMTSRRTDALGVLLPQDIAVAFGNPFYAQLVRGIGHVCADRGMTLMLVPPLQGSRLKAIPRAAVDGFIVVGLELERAEVQHLRRRNVPFVVVDGHAPEDISSINVDNRGGARAAMTHVLEQGHRRIALIVIESGKQRLTEYTGTLAERIAGYNEALACYGLALDTPAAHVVEAPSTREGGQAAFQQLWRAPNRPTAVVAMSDIIALGVMDAARAQGVQLPDALSIVGFDDLPEAQHARPTLTTVRQPIEEKGRLAAELIVSACAEAQSVERIVLPTELIARQSVAAFQEVMR